MALEAADKLSGPDAVKVRTFSSRMQVQSKTAQRTKEAPPDPYPEAVPQKHSTQSVYVPLCSTMNMLLASHIGIGPQLEHTTPSYRRTELPSDNDDLHVLPRATRHTTARRDTGDAQISSSRHAAWSRLHGRRRPARHPPIAPDNLGLEHRIRSCRRRTSRDGFRSTIAELVTWASHIGDTVNVPVDDTGAACHGPSSRRGVR